MLYEILASVTHNDHYLNKYINFITACQTKNEGYQGYIERHHICPKADDMFPEFASFVEFPWNCVKLTLRQHYIAHLLLYKTYPGVMSQAQTLYFMSTVYGKKSNSKMYAHLRTNIVKANKGKITVRDLSGKTFQVRNDDPRFISGELVGATKGTKSSNTRILLGKVAVRDEQGNTLRVDKTDPRYLSRELVSIAKGKVNVRDKEGNTSQVSVDDPRYISGEVVHVCIGLAPVNRALTIEQVKEIRLAIKNPTSVDINSYVSNVVIRSQKNKVGIVPITDLKYPNGRSISYKSLLIKYYTDKFKVDIATITAVINNKTYKEILV